MSEKIELRVCFVGDAVCEKTKLLSAYTTGQIPDTIPNLPSVHLRKAVGGSSRRKKVDVTIWAAAPEGDEHVRTRPLSYLDKQIYVFMFSFGEPKSMENVILNWIPEVQETVQNLDAPEKYRILLGVHSEERKDWPSALSVRNLAVAINANGYFEINSSDITSIRKAIDNIIKVALVKELSYPPERIDGLIQLEDSPIPYEWGRLTISVLRAANLMPKDKNGLSDPYCKFGWCNKSQGQMRYVHQTKRKKETLSPVWEKEDNNSKTYKLNENISKYRELKVQVWDHDITTKDDFEGEVNVPISFLLTNDPGTGVQLVLLGRDKRDEEAQEVSGSVTIWWKFKPRRRKLPRNLTGMAIKKANSKKAHSSAKFDKKFAKANSKRDGTNNSVAKLEKKNNKSTSTNSSHNKSDEDNKQDKAKHQEV